MQTFQLRSIGDKRWEASLWGAFLRMGKYIPQLLQPSWLAVESARSYMQLNPHKSPENGIVISFPLFLIIAIRTWIRLSDAHLINQTNV